MDISHTIESCSQSRLDDCHDNDRIRQTRLAMTRLPLASYSDCPHSVEYFVHKSQEVGDNYTLAGAIPSRLAIGMYERFCQPFAIQPL